MLAVVSQKDLLGFICGNISVLSLNFCSPAKLGYVVGNVVLRDQIPFLTIFKIYYFIEG